MGNGFGSLRPHARGGLGAVFVALDTELNREVALKQILDQHADDPVSRQRFVLEAEVTGGLEHPGIVPVYGLGRTVTAGRSTRCGSSEATASRRRSSGFTRTRRRSDPGRGRWSCASYCADLLTSATRSIRRIARRAAPGHQAGEHHSGRYGETLVVDWGWPRRGQVEPGLGRADAYAERAQWTAETLPGSALGTPAYMSPSRLGDPGGPGPSVGRL